MRKGASEIVRELTELGWTFTSSAQTTVGDWSIHDAEWNYRDIPHLNMVHTQVDGVLVIADHDFTSSVLVQKIGPIRALLPVVLMCDSRLGQVYYTCVGGISLVIETVWRGQGLGSGCEVTTTYFVGTRRLLRVLRPLIHKVLARNYRVLMSEDIPMRESRAGLRRRGYSFRQDTEGHSYLDSMKIAADNVIAPTSNEPITFSLSIVGSMRTQIWNQEQTRSISVSIEDGKLLVYPAICPHEGAPLTAANCNNLGRLVCPWHGRTFSPIAILEIGDLHSDTRICFDFDNREIKIV